MAKPTAKQIWDTLSKVDVSKHTEDRGGLTYLSWAWAWGVMMDHYPDLTIKWHGQLDEKGIMYDINSYPGGSAMVTCSVTIGDVKREMWLAVMDYRHKAIANPDARAISDAKMRCLTKCFALFGLGHYIYAGEDTPQGDDAPAPKKSTPKKSAPKKQPKPKTVKTAKKSYIDELKDTANDLVKRGWVPEGDWKQDIKDVVASGDEERAVAMIKRVKEAGEVALKLFDAKADEK